MENSKKNLKIMSFVIIALAALTFINITLELYFGELNNAAIPEGAPENILSITKAILLSVSLFLLLPQVYLGEKGLRVAKNPDSSKGHIVWAAILMVFAAIGLIDPIVALINQGEKFENFSALLSILTEAAVYFEYLKYAREVRKQGLAEKEAPVFNAE